eukprot:COSAG01_NODE_7656_length_3112_cov_2.297378_4_plen_96_part_00
MLWEYLGGEQRARDAQEQATLQLERTEAPTSATAADMAAALRATPQVANDAFQNFAGVKNFLNEADVVGLLEALKCVSCFCVGHCDALVTVGHAL